MPPIVQFGKGITVTITEFEFWQPVAIIVSVKVDVVVTNGLAIGLAIVVELRPVAGVHIYVCPEIAAAPIVTLPLWLFELHMIASSQASALGKGLTVTIM